MLTKEELLSRHKEVTELIRWRVGANGQRYAFVMSSLGSMDEFHSNVWFRLLSTVKEDVGLNANLSSVVIKAITWELSAMANRPPQDLLDYDDRRRDFRASDVACCVDESNDQHESLADLLWRLRRSVPDRVYGILWRLAGLDGAEHSMESIGQSDGISRQRVFQLVATVAGKLEPDENKQHQKIRETAWRKHLGKSVSGRILLQEFDEHCPLVDTV